MSNTVQEGVRREKLEIPSQTAFERRFLVDGGRPGSKPNISAPPPPTALLSRLQNFLPALQNANEQLQAEPAEQVQIDHASDEEGPYVELDLACGLFDLKDQAAVAAAERSLTQAGAAVERYDGGSSSDDSSDDEHEEGDCAAEVEQHPLSDAATPMDADAGGSSAAVAAAEVGGRDDSSSQEQQQEEEGRGRGQSAAGVQSRRRVKAKQKRRHAGIEVIS